MKTFKEFIGYKPTHMIEMADETGILPPQAHSKQSEWVKFYKDTDSKKLLLKDIGSQHLRLYRIGNINFFLTDEGDNYKGQIELSINHGVGTVSSSHSSLDRGFYNIIFTSLLATGLVSQILSDKDLSTNAISSYEKLSRNSRLVVRVFNPRTSEYLEFNKDNITANSYNRISITEKEPGNIVEHFNEYYSRVQTIYREEFNNYNSSMDNYLFCENYEPWYEEAMERGANGERYWEDSEFKTKYGW